MDLPADEITLPKDWRIDGISSHAEFVRGVSWKKDEETNRDAGTLVISIPNIRDGSIDFDSKFNHYLAKPVSEAKLLRGGDFVFVGSSGSVENVARSALVTSLPAKRIAFASFTFVGRLRGTDIERKFLYFALRSPLFPIPHFCKRAADGKFNFQLTDFTRNFRLPIPPLAEQRQIARVLSAVQRAIERQERLIALTAELKKALMHKLFTEGTRGESLKQTEIGAIPAGWHVVTIGELFKFSSGKSRPKDMAEMQSNEMPFPVLGGNGVMGYASASSLDEPTLVIGRVGVYCGCAHHTDGPAWVSDNALFAKWVSDRIDSRYAREFFEYADLNQHSDRAAQPLVTQGKLAGVKIPLPTKREQGKIFAVLVELSEKIKRHQRSRDLHEHLFRTLLHQLMTAQIRVHDLDLSALDGDADESIEPAAELAGAM